MRKEGYRRGHNGADSKSDGRVKPARGFDSHPFRLLDIIFLIHASYKYGAAGNDDQSANDRYAEAEQNGVTVYI